MTATPYTPPAAPRGQGTLREGRLQGTEAQPVSTVAWVPWASLDPNLWNPNRHARRELALLAISILEDGWTQPIVALPDGTIIDGYHRWVVCGWPQVSAMTDGLVPVVYLSNPDPVQQRMATVRHNRARGNHYVLSMADLVAELVALGADPNELGRRLQMEDEEVNRLLDRGAMPKRGGEDEFGTAWRPGEAAPRG